MSSMTIPINEENDDLLILYWMLKLYKNHIEKAYCRFFK
jgi:hypothetical protein